MTKFVANITSNFAMASRFIILVLLFDAGFLMKLGSCESFTCSTPDDWFGIHDGSLPARKASFSQALFNLKESEIRKKWPDAHVAYELSPTIERNIIQVFGAFREYHTKTCVRFVPATHASQAYTSIGVNNSVPCGLGTVCMDKENYARVGNKCINKKSLIHELGHNLCLAHEHQRHDRDDYVEVRPSCKTNDINWGKLDEGDGYKSRGIYDYASIMHYGCETCITPKNKAIGNKCGEQASEELSLLDADYINELYNCGGCFRHRWIPIEQLTREQKLEVPTSTVSPCRALFEAEIVVGTYHPLDQNCYVAFNGKEEKRQGKRFELLIIPGGMVTPESEYSWVEGHRNMRNYELDALFANAIPAGQMTWKSEVGRATGYVGYASLKYNADCKFGPDWVNLIGMVRRYHDGLRSFFPMILCGKEKEADKVKVLVCKSKLPHPLPTPKTLMERDLYRNWKQRYMRRVDFTGSNGREILHIPITIAGNILPNASEIYVDIAKQTAAGEILLHLRFLLSTSAQTKLTVSSLSESGWSGSNPITLEKKVWFVSGNNFKLQIHYERNVGFAIRLNGIDVANFAQRLTAPQRGFLRIHGDTIINHVEMNGERVSSTMYITKEKSKEKGTESDAGLWKYNTPQSQTRDVFSDYYGIEIYDELEEKNVSVPHNKTTDCSPSGYITVNLSHQNFIIFLTIFSVFILLVVIVIANLVIRLRRLRTKHCSSLSVADSTACQESRLLSSVYTEDHKKGLYPKIPHF